jgi:hypothetical protein
MPKSKIGPAIRQEDYESSRQLTPGRRRGTRSTSMRKPICAATRASRVGVEIFEKAVATIAKILALDGAIR